MRKKHFLHLAETVSRVLADWAKWSEPGAGGRVVSLDIAEDCLLDGMAGFVESQGGDGARWRKGVIARDRLEGAIEAMNAPYTGPRRGDKEWAKKVLAREKVPLRGKR